VTIETKEEKKLSRRSFVVMLFGLTAVIPAISLAPSDAEARVRNFNRIHRQWGGRSGPWRPKRVLPGGAPLKRRRLQGH
jgi:hypothetical protein